MSLRFSNLVASLIQTVRTGVRPCPPDPEDFGEESARPNHNHLLPSDSSLLPVGAECQYFALTSASGVCESNETGKILDFREANGYFQIKRPKQIEGDQALSLSLRGKTMN